MELILRNSDQKISNLNQHVLVIPSVSNGNVGQLAVECLVHNFDVANHLDVRSIGWLRSRDVLPLAGDTFLGKEKKKSLIRINLELYQDEKNKIVFLIQRAPSPSGKERAFSSSLLKWATSMGFERVLVLGGSATKDSTLNRPMNAMCVGSTAEENENLSLVAKIEANWEKFSKETWIDRFPYSGMLRLYLTAAQALKIRLSALVLPCVEGNNFMDGMRVAATALHYLSKNKSLVPSPDDSEIKWALECPRTWSLVDQDRPLESSMY